MFIAIGYWILMLMEIFPYLESKSLILYLAANPVFLSLRHGTITGKDSGLTGRKLALSRHPARKEVEAYRIRFLGTKGL